EIEQSINENVQAAVGIAVQDSWQRLYTSVARISERLNDPKAIFRDSLIDNAREICSALERLNVTNDTALETMRQRVLSDLTTFDPDVLRDTPRVRASVASKADDILKTMSGLFE